MTDHMIVTVDKIPELAAFGFMYGMGVEPEFLVGELICRDQEHPEHLALSAPDPGG